MDHRGPGVAPGRVRAGAAHCARPLWVRGQALDLGDRLGRGRCLQHDGVVAGDGVVLAGAPCARMYDPELRTFPSRDHCAERTSSAERKRGQNLRASCHMFSLCQTTPNAALATIIAALTDSACSRLSCCPKRCESAIG